MPYTGADDPKLPKNVKAMPAPKRRQFVSVFNSVHKKCLAGGGVSKACDSRAFRQANGVMKGAKEYVEFAGGAKVVKFEQDEVNYDPLGAIGAGGDRGCATCRWFRNDGGDWYSCAIVSSYPQEIYPSGLSDKYEAIPAPGQREPMPVVIMKGAKAQATAKSKLFGLTDIDRRRATGFKALQDADGKWCWVGWVTNNLKDRHGDTFTADAHEAYVKGRDSGKISAGDVWFWHTPGTSFATAEGCDYVASKGRGFLVEWGQFKEGYEALAKSFTDSDTDWAMSHTFIGLRNPAQKSEILRYTIYERGPLPRSAAANPWTGFGVYSEEPMPAGFSDTKKAELIQRFGEEKFGEIETLAAEMASKADAMGIEFKELLEEGGLAAEPKADAGAKSEPAATELAAEAKAIVDKVIEALDLTALEDGMKAMVDRVRDLSGLVPAVKALEETVVALQRSDDQKIAAVIRPKNDPALTAGAKGQTSRFGFIASAMKATEINTETEQGKVEASQGPQPEAEHPLVAAVRQATGINGRGS